MVKTVSKDIYDVTKDFYSKQMLFLLTFYSPKNTDLFKNVSFATFCIAFHKKNVFLSN